MLPAALPGIVSGCLLAVARAAGETAPLLFTIGASKATNRNVFSGANTSLSTQIFANASRAFAARRTGLGRSADAIVHRVRVHLRRPLVTARLRTNR